MGSQLFSDFWYQVAQLKVQLTPDADIQKIDYRGETWAVLHDPYTHQHFRVRLQGLSFLEKLDDSKSVEEVWLQHLEDFPHQALGQEEVIQLISQCSKNNLLLIRGNLNSEKLFKSLKKRHTQENKQLLLSFLFLYIPIFNPDRFLERVLPWCKPFRGWRGWLLWCGLVFWALTLVIGSSDRFHQQIQGLLSPSNLFWLYAGTFILKCFHEFGHGLVCKNYGGKVHKSGLMLLLFTPLPYIDTTSCWRFQSRWHRVHVGAAGMISELLVAAISAIVWCQTGSGTVIHALAFNMMIIGSVSSLLFNGNPLIRFDAYFILSDFLEIPNLQQRAKNYAIFLLKTHLLGATGLTPQEHDRREKWWLGLYALGSGLYRIVISIGIIFFVMDQWLFMGLVMMVLAILTLVCLPVFRVIAYVFTSFELRRHRLRAIGVLTLGLVAITIALAFWPAPKAITAPGVIENTSAHAVYIRHGGFAKTLHRSHGDDVNKGDLLLTMDDPELPLVIDEVQSKMTQTEILIRKSLHSSKADLPSLREHRRVLGYKLDLLREQRDHLNVRADQKGVWHCPSIDQQRHQWLDAHQKLGTVVGDGPYRFIAVVPQEMASDLFQLEDLKASIKLHGQADETIDSHDVRVVPYEKRELPSAALGWLGGGDIQVRSTGEGRQSLETFFEVQANLKPGAYWHGHRGVLRLELPRAPLLEQWAVGLRQLMQKRYRL